jgi:malonyl-CoA O-methyltransferase
MNQRERIQRAFAGAPDYDAHARVQREVANALAARIAGLDLAASPRVLEIGCGTGFLTGALAEAGIAGDWLVTDIAPEMVERCRTRMADVQGGPTIRFDVLDGEHGSLGEGAFDLICSSLAVQWFDDAPAALARLAASLAPGGHLVVTTLAPGSFTQWRAAHEAEGIAPGTPHVAPDARSFLRSLKAIGAGTSQPGHRPLSPAQLRRVMARFAQSGCEVTYQVVTCHLHRAR